jgi:hypothetical protein
MIITNLVNARVLRFAVRETHAYKRLRVGLAMLYAYALISLAMLVAAVALLVQTFRKIKNPLFQMFFGVIGVGLIACAVGVFLAAPH